MERDGGFYVFNDEFIQCMFYFFDIFFVGWSLVNEFSNYGIVIRWNGIVSVYVCVYLNVMFFRVVERCNFVWVWMEVIEGVFCIDLVFYSMCIGIIVVFFDEFICCDFDLFFNQVMVDYFFCDWVFYLNLGIYFYEVEVLVFVYEEFYGVYVFVFDSFFCFYSCIVYFFLEFIGYKRGGVFFYQFLVVVLNRVVLFGKVDDFVFLVISNLEFDMMGFFDEFFDVDVIVVKCCFCFLMGMVLVRFKFFFFLDNLYFFIVIVGSSFQDDWIVDIFSDFEVGFGIFDQFIGVGDDWDFCFDYGFFGCDFVFYFVDLCRGGLNKFDIVFGVNFGKISIFSQEFVVWVYCIGVGDFYCSYNFWYVQVRFCRGRWINVDCFISEVYVQVFFVGS